MKCSDEEVLKFNSHAMLVINEPVALFNPCMGKHATIQGKYGVLWCFCFLFFFLGGGGLQLLHVKFPVRDYQACATFKYTNSQKCV